MAHNKESIKKTGQLIRNPFFYLTIVLIFVVAFEAVQLVRAQFAYPKENPPNGQPYSPLDTGPASQRKEGELTIGSSFNIEGSLNVGTS